MSEKDNKRLDELLFKRDDGILQSEEWRELTAWLAQDEAARVRMLKHDLTSAALAQTLAAPRLLTDTSPALARAQMRRRSWWPWWLSGAITLGAAAAMVLWVVPRPIAKLGKSSSAAPVAVLVQQIWADYLSPRGQAPQTGDALQVGTSYALKAGRLQLQFRSGANVIVEAPAEFLIANDMRMILKAGACSVDVSAGDDGFTVETPAARVVDRGTKFVVGVSSDGETEVRVLKGAADVYQHSEPQTQPRRLREGMGHSYGLEHRGSRTTSSGKSLAARFPLSMPDRVVRYRARYGQGGVDELEAVTVHRGGVAYEYKVEDLIGIDLTHFKGDANEHLHLSTTRGAPAPPATGRLRRALLDRDRDLNTGVVNPGGAIEPLTTDPVMNDVEDASHPNTPGMAVRFHRPVANEVGPDVVMFEYQPVIQPEHGDPFHVSPLKFGPGLHSHTIVRWDLGTYSPEALVLSGFRLNHFAHPFFSVTDVDRDDVAWAVDHLPTTKAIAVAIDLSDLGYALGQKVDGLFFQDAPVDGPSHKVDPVFIAGLPPLPVQ